MREHAIPKEPISLDPHHITQEQALETMNSAIGQLYAGTRTPRNYTVQTLKRQDLQKAGTRTNEMFPDDILYIVNFDNDEGFALLAADDRIAPVLAITESGNLSAADIAGLAISDENIVIGSLIRGYIIGTIELEVEESTDESLNIQETEQWDDPYLRIWNNIKWHQGNPFNILTPLRDKVDEHGNTVQIHAPVGCAAIAVAEIMAYYQYPSLSSYGIAGTWEELITQDYYFHSGGSAAILHNEYNDSNFTPSSTDNMMYSRMSTLLVSIGNAMGSTYTASSTSTMDGQMKTYLSNRGYSSLPITVGTNSTLKEKIIDVWDNYGFVPVIVSALDRNNSSRGHAWVINGAGMIRRTSRENGPRYNEKAYMVHCLWGQLYGVGNGYYGGDIFTPFFGRRAQTENDDTSWGLADIASTYEYEVKNVFFMKR